MNEVDFQMSATTNALADVKTTSKKGVTSIEQKFNKITIELNNMDKRRSEFESQTKKSLLELEDNLLKYNKLAIEKVTKRLTLDEGLEV